MIEMPHPRPIGVRELRENMRRLLEHLGRGEHYLVLRHNRPVAALIPYEHLLQLADAVTRLHAAEAVLRSRGYDPGSLSTRELASLATGSDPGGGR
jgi:antitoxin (DNA-binding transcriptional repressor) of toxin-antitoxin stability system